MTPSAEPGDEAVVKAAARPSGDGAAKAPAQPQPDFMKHPPLHLKPACESASAKAASDGRHPCLTITMRCPDLDPGESLWLAASPAVAKAKLPEKATYLSVTEEDTTSVTVCCMEPPAAANVALPTKAKVRLFTNEVAGAQHELDCP